MTYIAFEGGEGSGKSTQARILSKRLKAVFTREPGATALGKSIRGLLLSDSTVGLDPSAEAYLMAADRIQHIKEIVSPALDAGKTVISDRSVYSSLAYQGFGRELGLEFVRQINALALDDFWPDLVVFINVPLEVTKSRLTRKLDRFESAGHDFHERVLDGYQKLSVEDPKRWLVVDGVGSIEEVTSRVWAALPDSITHKKSDSPIESNDSLF